MKKLAIAFLLLLSSITMVGCSNKSTKALSSFDNQLDYVEEIVGSTNSSEVSEVSPSVIYSSQLSRHAIQDNQAVAYNNLTREEEIRAQVLALSAYLKSFSCDKLKLNKSQSQALNNLSNNIKKYTSQLKNTKSEVKSQVTSIKKGLKNNKTSTEAIKSSYTTLNNSMNERYVCLCNIFNNLEQAYIIVYKDCENIKSQPSNQTQIEKDSAQTDENKINKAQDNINTEKENKTFKKNIDSYNFDRPIKENKQNNQYNSYYQYPVQNRMPYNMQNLPYGQTTYTAPYYPNGYGYSPYNNMYGYGNNYFNGMYGYNGLYNNQFNPSRNTDTFYSLNRNIDTYRFNPNITAGNMQNNTPFINNQFNQNSSAIQNAETETETTQTEQSQDESKTTPIIKNDCTNDCLNLTQDHENNILTKDNFINEKLNQNVECDKEICW